MTQLTRTIRSTSALVFFPLLAVLVASGCGSPADPGTETGSGGASPGAGGSSSGGTAPGAGGTSSGGTSPTSGGANSSGGNPGTGGASSGGTSGAVGGAATGGAGPSAGGSSSGGSSAGGSGSGGGPSGEPTFHVFMLMGQSNMAGVAKRQSSDANTDDRMKVFGGCNYKPTNQWNTVTNPPLSECPGERGQNPADSVDPGIWFAKTLLPKLKAGDTIGLVGTAESGESINTFITGGSHHQMILNKIAGAKTDPKARFAGIIFHQGESDSGQGTWPAKVVQLYNEVKAAWGVDYDVPMILGELPAGGCCSGHNTRVHEAADLLPMGAYVSQQGTGVMDQYHFNHDSVVLMGTRYGEKMIEMLEW